MYQSSYGSFPTNVSRFVRNSLNFLLLFLNEFVFIGSVPKQFLLDQTVTWAGPAKFRHLIKAFLFQKSALLGTKSTKSEHAITETENSKYKIQNTNPDCMQQQSGMFSSVFILNVLFDVSDDLSTFRASLLSRWLSKSIHCKRNC